MSSASALRSTQSSPAGTPMSSLAPYQFTPARRTRLPWASTMNRPLVVSGVAMAKPSPPSGEAGNDGFLGVVSAAGRVYPPGALAVQDADRLVQSGTDVVQADAVLGGVARGQYPVADHPPVGLPPGLVSQVVVDPVAVGHQGPPVGDRVERVPVGVGGTSGVPAQAPGARAGQHHAALPALRRIGGRP